MDGDTRALIAPSAMTMDEALRLINANHTRRPLDAEQVYVFGMTLSGQALDAYLTRMARSTLLNYERDFREGRALMNSHRTGRFNGELPVGRTFATAIRGEFLPDNTTFEWSGPGASLDVTAYIQRGLRVTDVATDDLIAGIDGGTINDVSVGFMMGPDGLYRCSLCSRDMADWWSEDGCIHVPGVTYEEGRAFAWVEGANGIEGSLCYKGANPEAMITKSIRMFEAGHLSQRDALMLEERLGARILKDRTLAVLKPARKEEKTVDWTKLIDELRAVNPALADRLTTAEEPARAGLVAAALREAREEAEALRPRAALGDRWMDDLVDQTIKMRVRAEADKFNEEKYRNMLRASNDPDFIRGELASWERQVQAVMGDGKRPTGGKKTPGRTAPTGVYKA